MPVKKVVTPKVVKKVIKKNPTVKSAQKKEAVESKVAVRAKVADIKGGNLKIEVYDLSGKVVETISLPKEIFGETVNKKLLAQAVRVYLANKRQGNASTKTRGEVEGSTRKIYRQKGTGNARHGSVRAPIFVKGGIVHGPRPRDFSLDFPKKMRRKALFSALSGKFQDGEVKVLAGFEKISPKTKDFVTLLDSLEYPEKKRKMLLIVPDSFESAKRAARNLVGVKSTSATRLNALEVLGSKHLLLTKEALSEMEKYFLGEGK